MILGSLNGYWGTSQSLINKSTGYRIHWHFPHLIMLSQKDNYVADLSGTDTLRLKEELIGLWIK